MRNEKFKVKMWDDYGTKVLDCEPRDMKEFMEKLQGVKKKYG